MQIIPKPFKHKTGTRERASKFTSLNHEKYNVPFTASELLDALHKSHDTAAGPDDIHYQILKHLPITL